MKETQIQSQILKLLEKSNEIYCFRAGSGCIQTAYGGYFKTGKKGLPDIICLYRGLFIGLEVKTDIGRQSKEQKEAEEIIKKLGGFYFVVKSTKDVIKIFNDLKRKTDF